MNSANNHGQEVLAVFQGRLGQVRLPELVQATGLPKRVITTACRTLVKNGLLKRIWRGLFILTKQGAEHLGSGATIHSGPKGPRIQTASSSLRSRIWRALRYRGHGSIRELMVLASRSGDTNTKDVRQYLAALAKAGLVEREGRQDAPVYCLVCDIGPDAPIWNRAGRYLIDPNCGEKHELA